MKGHKWWMKIFNFLFYQSIVNLYIFYQEAYSVLGMKSMFYMAFNIALNNYLCGPQISAWNMVWKPKTSIYKKVVNGPTKPNLRWKCIICLKKMKYYCTSYKCSWACSTKCHAWIHNH